MQIKNIAHVEAETVTMDGVKGTTIQWLYGPKENAPTFAMRRFVINPGGTIPLHAHPWEHEIYILQGQGEVFTDTSKNTVGPGDALFLPPHESHGYRNMGEEDLEFLCMVPNSAVG